MLLYILVKKGHLCIFKLLMIHVIHIDNIIFVVGRSSARNNHVSIIKYLNEENRIKNGVAINIIRSAIEHFNLDIISYIFENTEIDKSEMCFAIRYANYMKRTEILDYIQGHFKIPTLNM